jgi:hypothetical protein
VDPAYPLGVSSNAPRDAVDVVCRSPRRVGPGHAVRCDGNPVSQPLSLVLAWAEYAVALGVLAYFLLWRRP